VDAVRAVSALHESVQALLDALAPVSRAIGPFDVLTRVAADDPAAALVAGRVRSCVSSMYEVVADVLALGHLWDEQHLPGLATERPAVTATSLSIVLPHDAWWHATEALTFGSARGHAAVAGLRATDNPLADRVAAVVAAAETAAEALADVERFLVEGLSPEMFAPFEMVDLAEPAPEEPAAPAEPEQAVEIEPVEPSAAGRRQPRWGPGG
jgi:hypothetical protein